MRKLLILLAVLVLASIPVMADSTLSFGVGSADINGDAVDGDARTYAISFGSSIGKTGLLSGQIHVERMELEDVDTGAYIIDTVLGLRLLGDTTFSDGDPLSTFSLSIGGGLGGVWADPQEQTVEDGEGGVVGVTSISNQFLRWNAQVEGRFYFQRDQAVGIGGLYQRSGPMSKAVEVDGASEVRLFLIIPASKNPA